MGLEDFIPFLGLAYAALLLWGVWRISDAIRRAVADLRDDIRALDLKLGELERFERDRIIEEIRRDHARNSP